MLFDSKTPDPFVMENLPSLTGVAGKGGTLRNHFFH
jgi:hypothetical protein